ncbi:MAG: hypothetical protein ACFFF9_10820 [Candidatus Thorarchaeota archaeon]
MAFEDDYSFAPPESRTGPKAFTEYSFNAILVMVGLVGSFLATLGSASIIIFFMVVVSYYPGSIFDPLIIPGYIGIMMIPLGVAQVYYAWKIHTENFRDFQRIIAISAILIILVFASIFFAGFWIFIIFQIVIAQVFLNILVVFFLSKSEVQQEFYWEQGGD